MDKRLAECQRVIGYHFATPQLLEIALTHSSLRSPDRECNERLEFLGDSVLGLVVTEELYKLLPDQAEGELTRIKSAVVSRSALYRASTRLALAQFAQFARGVGRRNELPVSVIANLVESVIGAIYLDAGYFPAREFILRHLGKELDDTLNDRGIKNYKSLLQHDVQQAVSATPAYRTLDENGPHHRKKFTVAAMIQGREWGRGSGAMKKEAEQEAARKALEAWQRRGRGRRRRRKPAAEDTGAPPSPTEARASSERPEGRERGEAPRSRPERTETRSEGREKRPARRRERPPAVRPEAGSTEKLEPKAPPRPESAPRAAPAPPVDGFAAGLDLEPTPPRRPSRRRRSERPERAVKPEAVEAGGEGPAARPKPTRGRSRAAAREEPPRRAPERPASERPASERPASAKPDTKRPVPEPRAPESPGVPKPKRDPTPEPAAGLTFGEGLFDEPAAKPKAKRKPATRKKAVAPKAAPRKAAPPKAASASEAIPEAADALGDAPAPKRKARKKKTVTTKAKAAVKKAAASKPPVAKAGPKAKVEDGFAAGIAVPKAKRKKKAATKKSAKPKAARKVAARKSAPKAAKPKEPGDGFDLGS